VDTIKIIKPIGSGQYGNVYLGLSDDQKIAIKAIPKTHGENSIKIKFLV